MSELRTELTDLALAREQVSGIAAALSDERQTLHGSMQELLDSGWTGAAADEFAGAWGDWNAAAQEMLDGLQAMSRLLEAARVDFITTDDGAHGDMTRLSVRLGPPGTAS
jgi:WXG100 family type VII secretion target